MIGLGIVLAAATAFIISAAYYGCVPSAPSLKSAPQRLISAQMLVELLRNLAVGVLIAGLLTASNWSGPYAGILLGLSLWTLPVVLLAGSVFHEGVPMRTAVLHATDWLLKLASIGAILGLFS